MSHIRIIAQQTVPEAQQQRRTTTSRIKSHKAQQRQARTRGNGRETAKGEND